MSISNINSNKKLSNLRLPAEWEEQEAIILVWPTESHGFWLEGEYFELLREYEELIRVISEEQKVIIIASNENIKHEILDSISSLAINSAQIHIVVAQTNDIWVRDTGPITVYEDNKAVLYNFKFNGWGNKYPYEKDNNLNSHLNSKGVYGNRKVVDIDFILEGGSLESDGIGTLLTTESCLLNKNRNNFSKKHIEHKLKQLFNLNKILWLSSGHLKGDDTDGHIDTIARFLDPHTICYHITENIDDEHYDELAAMQKQLEGFKDSNNKPYKLVPIPLPSKIYDKSATRLPASYLNFLIINNLVIVPMYDVKEDIQALNTLREHFTDSDRKVIGVPAKMFILQYGSIHCASMNLYAQTSNIKNLKIDNNEQTYE